MAYSVWFQLYAISYLPYANYARLASEIFLSSLQSGLFSILLVLDMWIRPRNGQSFGFLITWMFTIGPAIDSISGYFTVPVQDHKGTSQIVKTLTTVRREILPGLPVRQRRQFDAAFIEIELAWADHRRSRFFEGAAQSAVTTSSV